MVRTAARVILQLARRGHGHFIDVSSVADELLSTGAPSIMPQKQAFPIILEARALKLNGVYVTNVRFGFVDTKMANRDIKPGMMDVEKKAVDHPELCISNKPLCYTAPGIGIPPIKFRKFMLRY